MTWLVILAVGAGSFVFRLGPLLVFERISLTERGDRVIRHAGTAAITALDRRVDEAQRDRDGCRSDGAGGRGCGRPRRTRGLDAAPAASSVARSTLARSIVIGSARSMTDTR